MNFPNLFIIGAAKSGTTSLYQVLGSHPEVFMSPRKEPHYLAIQEGGFVSFDGYKNTMSSIRTHPLPVHTESGYRKLFEEVDQEPIRGEASPLYLYSKYAPERIAQRSPNAHIVVLLRHPVDRAYSQFLHHLRDTHENTTDFVEAFENEEERLHRGPFWHYRRMGRYYEQLVRYYRRFSDSQMRIYLHEDLIDNQEKVWRDVFEFIEVDPTIDLPKMGRLNATGRPENKILHEILSVSRRFPFLREVVQHLPESVRSALSYVRRQNITKPELAPEVRRRLTHQYFEDDIRALQSLIDRDLTHWLPDK